MDSCLIFSIPCSGTHMLMKLLHLAGFYPKGNKNFFDLKPEEAAYSFTGHMVFTEENHKKLLDSGLKAIIITRYSKDVAVSLMGARKNKNVPLSKMDVPGDQSNMTFQELGGLDLPPETKIRLAKLYQNHLGWINSPAVYVTSFEKLVGSKGGGWDHIQRNEIIKIMEYLNKDYDDTLLDYLQKNLYGKGSVPYLEGTFRKGKIGSWRDFF